MKRELQARVQEATKDLAQPEELAYFRRFAASDSPLAREFSERRPASTASSGGDVA